MFGFRRKNAAIFPGSLSPAARGMAGLLPAGSWFTRILTKPFSQGTCRHCHCGSPAGQPDGGEWRRFITPACSRRKIKSQTVKQMPAGVRANAVAPIFPLTSCDFQADKNLLLVQMILHIFTHSFEPRLMAVDHGIRNLGRELAGRSAYLGFLRKDRPFVFLKPYGSGIGRREKRFRRDS